MQPLDYPLIMTHRRVFIMLLVVWLSPALLSFLPICSGWYTTNENWKYLKSNPHVRRPPLSLSFYRSALVSAFFIQFCSASEFLILFERRCAGVCVCLCARVPVRVCAYRWVSNMQFACSLRLKVCYKFPTCLALGHDLSEVDLCVCFAAFSRLSYARHIY